MSDEEEDLLGGWIPTPKTPERRSTEDNCNERSHMPSYQRKYKRDPNSKGRGTRAERGAKSADKPLTMDQKRWVLAYVELGSSSRAARIVGVSPNSVLDWKHLPKVIEEIELIRSEMIARTGYNIEIAMQEAGEAKEFARETGNANAYTKAVELRTKLNGLLIEKHDHRLVANFEIKMVGVRDTPALPPSIPVAVQIDAAEVLEEKDPLSSREYMDEEKEQEFSNEELSILE